MEQSIELIDFIYDNLIKEGIFIIIACYIIGTIVKNCMPRINNDLIVLIVTLCGIILSISMPMPGDHNWFLIGTKGLILGWASTGGYEFWKHLLKMGLGKKIKGLADLLTKDSTKGDTKE